MSALFVTASSTRESPMLETMLNANISQTLFFTIVNFVETACLLKLLCRSINIKFTDQCNVSSVPGYAFQDPSELLQFVRKDPADQKFYCTLCDKFSHKASYNTRNHVESHHFPNMFSYQCDQCDKSFATKSNFSMHRSRKHKPVKHQGLYIQTQQ